MAILHPICHVSSFFFSSWCNLIQNSSVYKQKSSLSEVTAIRLLAGNVGFTHTIHIPVMMKTGRLRGRMAHRDMASGWRSPLQTATTSPELHQTPGIKQPFRVAALSSVVVGGVAPLASHCNDLAWLAWPKQRCSAHLTTDLSCPLVAGCSVKHKRLSPCFTKQVKLHHVEFKNDLKSSKNDWQLTLPGSVAVISRNS